METDRTQRGDDWLEAALAADARDHAAYLADDGFAASVLAQLPHVAALPAWRRPVVALLWLITGGAVAVALPGLFYDVFHGLIATVFGQALTLPRIALAVTLLGALTWSTIVYAVREE
jgi:hypothetical protein